MFKPDGAGVKGAPDPLGGDRRRSGASGAGSEGGLFDAVPLSLMSLSVRLDRDLRSPSGLRIRHIGRRSELAAGRLDSLQPVDTGLTWC